ncbi:MAG: hypothetical protein ACUVQQ_01685 [Thermogutta sp.]
MKTVAYGGSGEAILFVVLAGFVTGWAGCGGKKSVPGRPDTVPVKVMVTYKGQPVADANVQFRPAAAGDASGVAATGTTNEQGTAHLTTFGQNDGAVPGSYRVCIRKSVLVGGPENADPDAPPVPARYREELPAKYAAPETSGLTAEVSKSQTEFTFDLTD